MLKYQKTSSSFIYDQKILHCLKFALKNSYNLKLQRDTITSVCCCCSVTNLCLKLCIPMDCSTPGFLSFAISQRLLKLMSIESVMLYNHLILCHPLRGAPWTARRLNQILKEISPEYTLEGLLLKLKLQYLGHLLWRANSLEKTLMLGKTEDRRRSGQ